MPAKTLRFPEVESSTGTLRWWQRREGWIAGLIVALIIWGLADVRRRGRIDPHDSGAHKTDVTVYTLAGQAMLQGEDPYAISNVRGWMYVYPPLFALVMAPLNHLHPQNQVLVWYFVSLLATWGALVEGRRLIGQFERDLDGLHAAIPRWMGIAALATALLPTLNCLQRGQVGMAKLYFLLLGYRLIVERRSGWRQFLGGVCLALPVALKITPLLPVAIVVFQLLVAVLLERRREVLHSFCGISLGVAAGGVLFFLALPAGVIGWQANWRHLQTWYEKVASTPDDLKAHSQVCSPFTLRNQSLGNSAYRCGNWAAYMLGRGPDDRLVDQFNLPPGSMPMDSPWVNQVLRVARFGLLFLLLLIAIQMIRRQDRLGQAAVFGLACVATLVVSPVARGHYFMLMAPAVPLVPLWLHRQGRPRLALICGVAPAVLITLHYVALDPLARLGLLGLGTAAWYGSTGVALLFASPATAAAADEFATTLLPFRPKERLRRAA
jgi:hypothetical protein